MACHRHRYMDKTKAVERSGSINQSTRARIQNTSKRSPQHIALAWNSKTCGENVNVLTYNVFVSHEYYITQPIYNII